MFDPPLASGHWAEIGVHRYTWMGVGDLLIDYEPARGNYSIVNINRAAQAGEDPKGAIATRGHLMATSKAFVSLGEGMLMLASDGIASAGVRSADGPGGTPPGGIAPGAAATATPPDAFGDGAYAMWSCSHDSAEYCHTRRCPAVLSATPMASAGRTHAPPAAPPATARARPRARARASPDAAGVRIRPPACACRARPMARRSARAASASRGATALLHFLCRRLLLRHFRRLRRSHRHADALLRLR